MEQNEELRMELVNQNGMELGIKDGILKEEWNRKRNFKWNKCERIEKIQKLRME